MKSVARTSVPSQTDIASADVPPEFGPTCDAAPALIDLGYIGGLTAFDSLERPEIVAAVLLFRALTYGIQIPNGWFTSIIWRVKSD